MNIRLTDEFEVFARTAGYTVEYLEDAVEIYNLGGEIRSLVHRVGAEVVIESAERARDYSVEAKTSTEIDAERYLTYELGGPFREALGLRVIVTGFVSVGAPEVLITYAPRVTTLEWTGEPDRKVQLFGPGKHSGEIFSFAMKLSLAELRASFAAEDGLPLYAFLHRDDASASTSQVEALGEIGRGLFHSLAAKAGQTLDDPLNVIPFDGGVAVIRAVRGGGKIFVAEDGSVMYRGSSYTFERALEEFRAGERTPLESFR
ncbi:hypothetical protein [Arenivirga flava]|uniref:Uncharacterized protein n=1 Tax=Arenivirga flava TaxID=1930060 RepID=A0AA37ULN6_9MICO|nr:hypothetical protein [Arenivirga flava]GMA27246.1 hypothetical protein GCM10025874_04990 [Arenivirga flava]